MFEISEESVEQWKLKKGNIISSDERSDIGLMFLDWVRKTTDWNGVDPILIITRRDW